MKYEIKDMFYKRIERDIKGVIKVGQSDEENVKQELEEYVVTEQLRDHIDVFFEAYKKGKLASTDLSMQTTTDENGNKVYLTADENNPSQNDFVYNKIKDAILQLDSIIGSVDGKKNDDELME